MKLVRIANAHLVPKRLVEDNKDRVYPVERFYNYLDAVLISGNDLNPFEFLYLILNEENEVIGFVWYSINALENDIFINTISVDRNHRENGKVLNWVYLQLKRHFTESGYRTVSTISSRKEWHKKNGFEESKNILLEYRLSKREGEQNG